MGRFSVSGSFFGESKNDPQEKLISLDPLLQWVVWVVLGPLGRFSVRPGGGGDVNPNFQHWGLFSYGGRQVYADVYR